MSITRSLLNEFRPLFQMLDEPFYATASDPFALVTRQRGDESPKVATRSPHVHMTEDEHRFLVEAEIPGVPKENLDISIGDNGRSLTIKGNTFTSSEEGVSSPQPQINTPAASEEAQVSKSPAEGELHHYSVMLDFAILTGLLQVGQTQPYRRWTSRSSFARTIWLPRPVDSSKVAAKLDHGVLTLEIPKLQATTQRITIA